MRARMPGLIAEARVRGDIYGLTQFQSGVVPPAWLAAGDAAEARRMIDDAIAPWQRQRGKLAHLLDLQAETHLDLYLGDPSKAHRRIVELWGEIASSRLLYVQYLRVTMLDVRARAALALAAAPGAARESGDDASPLLKEAARIARKLDRERAAWASALAAILHACVARGRRRTAESVELLDRAAAACDACGMHMHAAAARWQHARVVGGDAGAELARKAEVWLRKEDVREPQRFLSMLTPGFD